jgi:hypothetical protein
MRVSRSIAWVVPILFVACGGGEAEAPPVMEETLAAAEPMGQVRIASPADGSTVDGPTVTVVFEVEGFQVVPAGDTTPNSGHHHVFLDRDVTPAGQPIPVEEGFVVHVGTGAGELVLEGVAPGEHRLIAVVGDFAHMPVEPMVADTIMFTVR